MGNGRLLLFHNTENSQPPKLFKEYLTESVEDVIGQTLFYKTYGNRNTGTYLMTDSLVKIIDADELIPRFYEFHECVDTVVTNVMHRIGDNLKIDIPYWDNILRHTERLVPLSLGFAFQDGKISPMDDSLKRLLCMIAERTEIGVRTEYDAEFLSDSGIKNVCVIGCPSLFYHMDRNFRVDDSRRGDMHSVNFNFSSDFGNLGISQRTAVEVHWRLLLWFKWQYERLRARVHLTMQKPPFAEICDMHNILLSYKEVHLFYKDCGRYFYSVGDWIAALREDDFSMGSRFHGNIAAILSGTPTLMVNIDKRMKGMNDFYKIPSIDIEEFDLNQPIEYYRQLADYSEFNKSYADRFDNFVDYCKRNGVKLRLEHKTEGMNREIGGEMEKKYEKYQGD